MKTQTIGASTEILLTIPSDMREQFTGVINVFFDTNGLKVRRLNEDGEELFSAAEVFSEANPGMVMHGFRLKEEWSQEELANRLSITQTRVSELESGKRAISIAMAKRLGQVFDISYKAFL
jgi:DNA-binding XRE family transcriptional regulator